MSYLVNLYKPFNLSIDSAKGCYIKDIDGNNYLDLFAGIGVNALGHCDINIINAIKIKIEKYMHLSNFIKDPDSEYIAKKLCSYFDNKGAVIFTNSGTESNEVALKLIRKIHDSKKKIISFTNSFHGRSTGSLSLTGINSIKNIFLPLLPDIEMLPYNNAEILEKYINKNGNNISAIFLEFIQGAGGIIEANNDFINVIKNLRNKYNYCVIADEIQSGIGRTGNFFSFQHYSIKPDIVSIAKAIGGGLPLGALLVSEKYKNYFKHGEHGSTFAPNPIALAAANIVLDKINNNFLQSVSDKGEYVIKYLKKNLDHSKYNIRGKGLMIGIDINDSADIVKKICFKNKVLINTIANRIIRLLPPLIITKDELIKGSKIIISAINDVK